MTQQPKEKSDVIKLKLNVFTFHQAPTRDSLATLIVDEETARDLHRQLGKLFGAQPAPSREWSMHDEAMETLYAREKWEDKP